MKEKNKINSITEIEKKTLLSKKKEKQQNDE